VPDRDQPELTEVLPSTGDQIERKPQGRLVVGHPTVMLKLDLTETQLGLGGLLADPLDDPIED
jgi:hypothetical protein